MASSRLLAGALACLVMPACTVEIPGTPLGGGDDDEDSGGGVRYPGLLGLAPEWVGGECGPSCQRWISACVLAHANAFGVQVIF